MSFADPCCASAAELTDAYRRHAASPVEVVDAVLERIESVDPSLNAFCLPLGERAQADAQRAEAALAAGEPLGPLHGVPVSIKDVTPTKGVRTTFGSRAFAEHIPAEDAILVERLRSAGAILLGKTATSEFGNKAVCESVLSGITRNPWDGRRTSGGSSGGSAVAVASGMGPLAEGTDGAGSIRIPASFCGVLGLKPSFGRVPVWPRNGYETISHHGPIARTAADIALMLSVIAGPDPRDPYGPPTGPTDFIAAAREPDIGGWRIGFSPDLGLGPVEHGVAVAVSSAVPAFVDLGAHVDQVTPDVPDASEPMSVIWRTSLGTIARHRVLPVIDRNQMDQHLVELMDAAEEVSAVELYTASQLFRHSYFRAMTEFFKRFRLLVTPTSRVAPFPHLGDGRPGPARVAGQPSNEFLGWLLTYPFNLTGQPAITVPSGFDERGLPIGLQIIGRPGADADVIQAAAALERVLGRPEALPPDPDRDQSTQRRVTENERAPDAAIEGIP